MEVRNGVGGHQSPFLPAEAPHHGALGETEGLKQTPSPRLQELQPQIHRNTGPEAPKSDRFHPEMAR